MILVDANLLLYATVSEYPQHERARNWLESCLNGQSLCGLPWPSLVAFLRIVTNRRLFSRPLGTAEAWRRVTEWLALPNVWIPTPTERHGSILGRLIGSCSGNLVPDAHLAALAIEHGLTLFSSDGDFARFADLRWANPLQ